ncbi:hypothetical protein EN780_17825 [Mesorhizobium sp. M4B.F.Ca.ET.089.01.1.1]|uniref:Uncharacterized protein n=1 Tax=Mesorhizobium abyssinicae TaxID=1209958 RepID=A0ABU5ASQ6_9HYPH|nr:MULTISPECIES: hypothetical protein [Mesorhizobium]MDX8540350.1 hypothetical protein [Mesorhizobium abyssinicae]RWX65509.1 hypothetical protein EN780_17825 [Mesorhizobium sp. M4B.F.Ca.ET.089.01.1.1]
MSVDRTLYILFKATAGEEDDRLVASGRVADGSVSLRRREEVADLISFTALQPPFKAQAAGMTGQGEVVYFSQSASQREQIPGAGFASEGARKFGRMTKILQIGDRLMALGYGGQVYMRTPSEAWRFLAGPKGSDDGSTNLVYFSAIEHKGRLYFGGTETKRFKSTAEIDAASQAGDGRRLARAILAAKVPDRAVIWAYDGSWSEADFDHPGTVVEMLEAGRSIEIFTTNGRIVSTPDFQEFSDVFAFGKKKSFWDIKRTGQGVLVYFDGTLFRWTGEMEPFEPSLPIVDENFINVSSYAGLLGAFAPHQIYKLDGDDWGEVTYTLS